MNPQFRSSTISTQDMRDLAAHWGIVNGIAVVTVAVALVLLTSWRATLLDAAADADGVSGAGVSSTASARS